MGSPSNRAGPKFPLGQLVMTQGAAAAFAATGEQPLAYVVRHVQGDWGELDAEDWKSNDQALKDGSRVLSSYRLGNGEKLWIITEADRSCTTVLLPEEY